MPYFRCTLVPPPRGTLPPLAMAWPPISFCASTTITDAPASRATMAAGIPVAPEPITTTSATRSHSTDDWLVIPAPPLSSLPVILDRLGVGPLRGSPFRDGVHCVLDMLVRAHVGEGVDDRACRIDDIGGPVRIGHQRRERRVIGFRDAHVAIGGDGEFALAFAHREFVQRLDAIMRDA